MIPHGPLEPVERPGGDAGVLRIKNGDSPRQKGLAIKTDVTRSSARSTRGAARRSPWRNARARSRRRARSRSPSLIASISAALKSPRSWSSSSSPSRESRKRAGALETPVVSGNVSFYNETEGRAILPTPTIGMIGLLDDVTTQSDGLRLGKRHDRTPRIDARRARRLGIPTHGPRPRRGPVPGPRSGGGTATRRAPRRAGRPRSCSRRRTTSPAAGAAASPSLCAKAHSGAAGASRRPWNPPA